MRIDDSASYRLGNNCDHGSDTNSDECETCEAERPATKTSVNQWVGDETKVQDTVDDLGSLMSARVVKVYPCHHFEVFNDIYVVRAEKLGIHTAI